MKIEKINLPVHYGNKVKGNGENPTLTAYLLDNFASFDSDRKRPLVIVCPGGGYSHLSDREGEAVAVKMNSFGFQAAVLKYSLAPAEFPAQICDAAEAVFYARSHAEEWHVDPDKIILCGFSAGGHVSASLGAFYKSQMISNLLPYKTDEIKPNALCLCYPVITAKEGDCHEGSVKNLLGNSKYTRDDISLEKHIGSDFPPVFIWHTNEDSAVPAENSLYLVMALRKAKVPFEYHLFEHGHHGTSLCTEETARPDNGGKDIIPQNAVWPELFYRWVGKTEFLK